MMMLTARGASPLEPPLGPASTLREYFERHLKVPEARGRLSLHVLTDTFRLEDWHSERLGPRRGPREHLQARHTILLFLGATAPIASPAASPPRRRGEQVLVLGLSCWEYAWSEGEARAPSRAYIQYVDSTGMFRPRRAQGALTRAVLTTYLHYCRDVLRVAFVHLLASPKPSLLFPGSENLPRKRLLDGPHLINWWMSLVQAAAMQPPAEEGDDEAEAEAASANLLASPIVMGGFRRLRPPSPPPPMEAFVYSAVEEGLSSHPQSLRTNLQILNRICLETGTNARWHWGWPYDAQQGQDAIPLFEDDPKWRHYEAALEDLNDRPAKRQRRDQTGVTVKEFFETIACRSEFRHELSVFLVLKFPLNLAVRPSALPRNNFRPSGVAGDFALFISKLLLTLKFGTEADALRSSMCIWSWLKLRGVTPLEVEPSPPEEIQEHSLRFHQIARHLEQPRGISNNGSSTAISGSGGTAFNDLQALIRRKPHRGS